jgi:ankyrin repeat protein
MIILANMRGDVAQLRRWAERGVRVNSGEPLCQAVLFLVTIGAVRFKNKISAVRCLVKDLGADVNQADEEDWTPLCIAALSGNLKMMRYLVPDLGADVEGADKKGKSPLRRKFGSGAVPGQGARSERKPGR